MRSATQLKKLKRLSVLCLIAVVVSSVLVTSNPKQASAGTLTSATDIMSRQKTGVSSTHQFVFTLATAWGTTTRTRFTQANFTFTGSPSFSGTGGCTATTAAFAANVVAWTSVSSCDPADTVTITTAAIANPAATTYVFAVETDPNNDGVYTDGDSSNVAVDILTEDQVTVSASIGATYDFAVSAKSTGTVGSGGDTCESSGTTATAINFNNGVNLTAATQYTHCQTLTVSTNATGGFKTLVAQSANLTNGVANTIDSFDDGTPPSVNSETTWSSPSGQGHFGFASNDAFTSTAFTTVGANYGGFTGTTAYKVQEETVPVTSYASNVGYSLEINATQEPGTYTNTLTYTSYGVF